MPRRTGSRSTALNNAVTTARTLNRHQAELDAALLAAIGFANTGNDIFTRSKPYLERLAGRPTADRPPPRHLQPGGVLHPSELRRPCAQSRRARERQPLLRRNSVWRSPDTENPYVYPDNLPRVNGRGGPGGKPGCWQPITRDLWPAPYLVMDSGNSIAPYNHFELSQPLASEYVWGRQYGENTINP